MFNISVSDVEEAIKYNFDSYKPHQKQLDFHNAGKEAIERIFLAGNRVGKTYCGCIELCFHLTGRYPDWWQGWRFDRPIIAWLCSESLKDIRGVLQPLLIGNEGVLSKQDVLQVNYGNHGCFDYISVRSKFGKNSILYSKSYEQGRQKFQGSRVDFIHMDEECNYNIYKECLMRLSDVDGRGQGRMMVTATPLKGMTELMCHYLRKQLESGEYQDLSSNIVIDRKYHLHASWNDNPYLSDETKEHLRNSLQPYELEARDKGIPTIGTGLIYHFADNDVVCDPFVVPDYFSYFAGMDVGYNNPTAVVFCAYDRDKDIIYIYKDYCISEQTPYIHSNSLLSMGLDWIPVLCDPSVNQRDKSDGVSLGEHYRKAGLNYINAKYAKETAISEIYQRVRTGRLKIFKDCVKTLDERRRYSRGSDGKPIKRDDHLMNALEFAILDGLKYARSKNENFYRPSNFKPRLI